MAAGGIRARDHARVRGVFVPLASRPTDLHGRSRRQPAGVARGPDDLPLFRVLGIRTAPPPGIAPPVPVVFAVTPPFLRYLDDRDAVRVLRLPRLLDRPVRIAIREQQAIVRVFVVLNEKAMLRRSPGIAIPEAVGPVERKVHHAVVVHAPLLRLLGRGVAGVGFESRPIRHRIAPRDEHIGAVAGRHDDGVFRRDRNSLEAEKGIAVLVRLGGDRDDVEQRADPAYCRGRRRRNAAAEESAARHPGVDHFLECRIAGRIAGSCRLLLGDVLPSNACSAQRSGPSYHRSRV